MTFEQVFPKVFKNEGGYANQKNDTGGETYGGISRVYFPKWEGWALVDQFKKQNGGFLPRYWRNATLDAMLPKFYKEQFWDANHMDKFPAQLRLSLFDMAFNGGAGKAWGVLRMAAGMKYATNFDTSLFEIAKKVTPEQYAAARIVRYEIIVRDNPKNQEFLEGWKNRTAHILKETKNWILANPGASGAMVLLLGIGIFVAVKAFARET